jgi:hypothetical protein
MVGTYPVFVGESASPGEIDAYSEQLQETVRVMYALLPEDRFAELYIMAVNLNVPGEGSVARGFAQLLARPWHPAAESQSRNRFRHLAGAARYSSRCSV